MCEPDRRRTREHRRFLNSHLFEMYSVALEEFPKIGWEGDGMWYYAGSPGHTSGPEAILAVKQGNNGTVFVLSRLPLYERHANGWKITRIAP
jgi:hypothetical protein